MTENEVVHVFGNTKKPKMNTISHLGLCMQFAILNIFGGRKNFCILENQ